MSDYHREYADQADARIRELEDKLAGAVEVLNGAGVKMCELIDQLAAYKVAIMAQEKSWCLALIPCDPSVIHDVTSRAIKTRHPLVSEVISKAAIDAAKEKT